MADAVYKQTLDAVVSTLQGLSLSGIENAEIAVRKLPDDASMINKGITVSWDDELIDYDEPGESTNERDMLGYPCILTICSGTGRGWDNEMTLLSTWRQAIRRAFHAQRLSGVSDTGTNHVICKVQHGHPSAPREYVKNRNISQMIVWCWFLESRS